MNIIDDFTFGNSPAAVHLARVLGEMPDDNQKILSKVQKCFVSRNRAINSIKIIEDAQACRFLGELIRNDIKLISFSDVLNAPKIIESLTRNVLLTKLKQAMRENACL